MLGFRPGSTPILFFEEAMRMNGVNPDTDVKLANNIAVPARVGAWLAGQGQYAIFIEPDASQLELDGKGFLLASIGATVGFADYTSFMATDKYLADNAAIVQSLTDAIYRAQKWTASASAADIAQGGRAVLPRRQSAGADQCGRALSEAENLEIIAGDRARGDRASSRTSSSTVTCSTPTSA